MKVSPGALCVAILSKDKYQGAIPKKKEMNKGAAHLGGCC